MSFQGIILGGNNILFEYNLTMLKIISVVEFEWRGERGYQLNLPFKKH